MSRVGRVGQAGRVGRLFTCLAHLSCAAFLTYVVSAQPAAPFQLEETTIAQIQSAFRNGSLTCRGLVDRYIARIEAYDQEGPSLNAIVMVNPEARKVADDLDRRFR